MVNKDCKASKETKGTITEPWYTIYIKMLVPYAFIHSVDAFIPKVTYKLGPLQAVYQKSQQYVQYTVLEYKLH